MGNHLSKPITDKESMDDEDDRIKFGASSMQGWRLTQEDAHNNILDYDEDASFFAVYDGHGGHEVALYCSQQLPQYIKATDAYKNKDYKNALIEGFLGFDGTLTTENVVQVLRDIIKPPGECNEASDEENVNTLFEEATMPIDKVIQKYIHAKDGEGKHPISPFLRACKSKKFNCGSSSTNKVSSSMDKEDQLNSAEASASSSKSRDETVVALSSKEETSVVADQAASNGPSELVGSSTDAKQPKENSSNKCENIKNDGISSSTTENKSEIQLPENDEKGALKTEDKVETTPKENGTMKKKGGKVFEKTKGVVVVEKKIRPKRSAQQIYQGLLVSESDSESEDEEDKTFVGPNDESSDEEQVANIPNESSDESSCEDDVNDGEEDELDDSDIEEEEEEEDDEDERDIFLGGDKPGTDSGCTAVVALIRGTEVYVANAGDSRCIICRDGKAVDLSIDHKPTDDIEYTRITKAGGRVDYDGRVNGNLNLSRAIGDHAYKLKENLPDREQMITALPDIQTYTMNPSDEFMVIACDGIWNCMSSQEVADFVKSSLEKNPEKLSQVCEELCDHCLAPDTDGDGTGCDNMTVIILKFKSGLFKRSAPCDAEDVNEAKRAKTDNENVIQESAV